ncbi:uncharacterized protein LOC115376417 [Myripristis murdjan]|uniref:uncharacterized protein LOC115376417 n=1 Tax=Myripristis murdjan TaxID=586833 RepID=UPI001175D78F|nr:uncharacterized protein LOC115376417 [Myripristis murdjan]
MVTTGEPQATDHEFVRKTRQDKFHLGARFCGPKRGVQDFPSLAVFWEVFYFPTLLNGLGGSFTMKSIFLVVFLLSTPAEAQFQVIGSLQPITATVGDAVILPCRVEPEDNVEGLTVEWTRRDLRGDPGNPLDKTPYVHLYRGRREDLVMKNDDYRGRTFLLREDLRRGNMSLKLVNVGLSDAGTYRCFVPKLQGNRKETVVQLIVESLPQTTTESITTTTPAVTPGRREKTDVEDCRPKRCTWETVIAVVVSASVVILVFAAACLLHRCRNRQSEKPHEEAQTGAAEAARRRRRRRRRGGATSALTFLLDSGRRFVSRRKRPCPSEHLETNHRQTHEL